jgi:hypothetical protein
VRSGVVTAGTGPPVGDFKSSVDGSCFGVVGMKVLDLVQRGGVADKRNFCDRLLADIDFMEIAKIGLTGPAASWFMSLLGITAGLAPAFDNICQAINLSLLGFF